MLAALRRVSAVLIDRANVLVLLRIDGVPCRLAACFQDAFLGATDLDVYRLGLLGSGGASFTLPLARADCLSWAIVMAAICFSPATRSRSWQWRAALRFVTATPCWA